MTLKSRVRRLAETVGLKLIRFAARESNLVQHAKSEWKIAFPEKCEMQDAVGQSVFDVCAIFSLEGHSGGSAGYTVGFIEKALRFAPLSSLKGTDEEWMEVAGFGDEKLFQNRRCPHVFKDGGDVYDINGRVFVEPSGAALTGRNSRVPVEFPYYPKTVYVNVDEDGEILEGQN